MASKKVVENNVSSEESESESENNQSNDSSDEDDDVENINVEFEAQTPDENDFHGIKQLLLRSILLLHVDASDMTDLIISQTSVGSTVKIVDDEENEVYGIFTILSLKKYHEKKCIKELIKDLQAKCKSCAKEKLKQFEDILKNKNIGYLVSERFINIPAQLAVPFHNSLKDEVDLKNEEDLLYKFDYLLLISKTLKQTKDLDTNNDVDNTISSSPKTKKKKLSASGSSIESKNEKFEYTNFEDELFHKESVLEFSYSVTEATGLAVSGSWDLGDCPMNTYRTVMLVPAKKWKTILLSMKEMVDTT